ncbi:MAG: hypothetical protein WC477_00440 [Patescibacteria group bacterium]
MYRLEATMHGPEDAGRVAEFCRTHGITSLHIVHTAKGSDPADNVKRIRAIAPGIRMTAYICAKHVVDRSVESGRIAFRQLFAAVKKEGAVSTVVTSGYPRGDFDSIEALRSFPGHHVAPGMHVSCVYNPYYDPARLREEQDRLRSKLLFPFVEGVVFQIGMDTEKLKKGAEAVRAIRPDIQLLGVVPAPAEGTLAYLRDNAPYGIFLPNSYLLNVETASEMTQNLLHVFYELGIEPVIHAERLEDAEETMELFAK